jgi:hypothetical protein
MSGVSVVLDRRTGVSSLAVAAACAVFVFCLTAVGTVASHHSLGYFTRDPAAITHQPGYVGMVTLFGLFGWCTAATALVFSGYLAALRNAVSQRNAFLVGAAAVVYLMFDDAFQFHDYVYPRIFGGDDRVIEAGYVCVVLVLVYLGRAIIVGTKWHLLVAAGVFFSVSVGLDMAVTTERAVGIEDGAKFLGILLLGAYCFETAVTELAAAVTAERAVGQASSPE